MNTRPASVPTPDDERLALLSALADGQADALQRGCELWRDDAQARATWHAYHLIGDVMRSDELAQAPARDAAFLAALRTRLADEPVLLAPAPAPAAPRRQRWLVPAAAAAGFVAVAGVMVVARMQGDAPAGPMMAVVPPAGNVRPVAAAPRSVGPLVIEGRLIRDSRLDAYLEAHRQAFGGPSAAVPGGVPRNIEAVASQDAPGGR